jgi:hypothetical protein
VNPGNAERFYILQETLAMPRTKKGTPPSYRKHSSPLTGRSPPGYSPGPLAIPESFTEFGRVLAVLKANQGLYPVAESDTPTDIRFRPYMLRLGRKMVIERQEGSEAARCVLDQKSIQSTTH